MEEHQRNSLVVGRWLEQHPGVLQVRHPGLPSHPQHHIVLKQQYGHSGMISFYLNGKLEESRRFLKALKVGRQLQSECLKLESEKVYFGLYFDKSQ